MFEPNIATEIREKIDAVFYDGRIVPAHTEHEHFYRDTEDGEVYPSVTTKTSLLSRKYYKQLAADKAVEYIQAKLMEGLEPEEMAQVFADARKRHEVDLNQAGTWGTHGHDLVDRYVTDWINTKSRKDDISQFVDEETSPEGVCAGLGAMKFFDTYTLFPIASEMYVMSKKHKYAGTLDSLFLVGKPYGPSGRMARFGDKDCEHVWMNKSKNNIQCEKCDREEVLTLTLVDWKTSNQIFGHGSMGKYDYAMQVAAYSMALKEVAGIPCKQHWIVRLDKYEPKFEVGNIPDIKTAGKAFIAMNFVSDYARSKEPAIEQVIKKQRILV